MIHEKSKDDHVERYHLLPFGFFHVKKFVMRRVIIGAAIYVCLVLVILGALCCGKKSNSGLHAVDSFEGATLYQTTNRSFYVVSLSGDYHEMGRQYGKLLSSQMRGLYNEVIRQFDAQLGVGASTKLITFCTTTIKLYPDNMKTILDGEAETSGLTVDEIAVINEFFSYTLTLDYDAVASNVNTEHCAAITAWGDYTVGSQTIMGRDFDFPTLYKNFDPYVTVVAFNSSDGSTPTAVITYAGQVGAIQAFNKAGLVVENNDGSSCGDTNRYFDQRASLLPTMLQYMLGSASIANLNTQLLANQVTYPLIYNAANSDQAYCYESATTEVKRRESQGLLVATNHFLNPDWTGLPTPYEDSVLRYNNLVNMGTQAKGKLDAAGMMSILDTNIEDGGATSSDTIYQFVAIPATLTWWLKAPGYSDWTQVDLTLLFK